MTAEPVLSAIVISQNDEERIERAVRSVAAQELPEPFEVIVVVSGQDRTAEIVRERFPEVRLVELPRPALPGEARNAGLRIARGTFVSFPGSHVELPAGSLAARLRAHRMGYDMVSGSMLNGTDTPSGWAAYFLDQSWRLPGRPSAVLETPPSACSYRRDDLLALGGFPEDRRTGEDTVVNEALFRSGKRAYRAPDALLIHHTPCRTLRLLLGHHFQRGRGFGRILVDEHRARGGLLRGRGKFLLGYVSWRLGMTDRNVARWGGADLARRYRRVRPLVALAAIAAWVGLWSEVLAPGRGKIKVLIGRGSG